MKLILPDDYDDYGWEVEAKGWFEAQVSVGDSTIPVLFYDPVRLAQDVEAELAERGYAAMRRIVVVPAVTENNMRAVVARLSPEQVA